jgi:UDP-2,3-diacylglucosamine pyrophosphatase LpxH
MERDIVDTVIVSDIHLGSLVSRVGEFLKIFKEKYCPEGKYLFKRFIVNGDFLEDTDLGRLKHEHWQFLSFLRKMSNPKTGVEVVGTKGNHDGLPTEILSYLLGFPIVEQYEWSHDGKQCLAIHGDIFDRFLVENVVLSDIASWIYLRLQRFDPKRQAISRFLKRKSKLWLRNAEKVKEGALQYARQRSISTIFCGHTHQQEHAASPDGIDYYNSGCLTDMPGTYITVGEDGVVIHEF